jgi:hypothetical protein
MAAFAHYRLIAGRGRLMSGSTTATNRVVCGTPAQARARASHAESPMLVSAPI